MNLADVEVAVELLRAAAGAMRASSHRRGSCVLLPAQGTLIAAGDLHDNPAHLRALLALAGLDGHALPSWDAAGGGSAPPRDARRHLVIHELIHSERLVDGVDLSHRMLLRACEAILRHPDRVHVLLANHEIAQLRRRGVSKGAGDSVRLFQAGLEYVYGDAAEEVEGAIDEFIRALPLAARSEPDAHGRAVLCAHSLPGLQALRHVDLSVLDRPMVDGDYDPPSGSAYLFTWGRELPADHLRELGERLGISLFCLGHQHAETGVEMLSPNALVINSDHQRAAAIPLDLAAVPAAADAVLEALPLASVSFGDRLEGRSP